MKLAFFVGRAAFGGFFLYNGIHHLQQRRQLAQYAGAKGVPVPEALVAISGAQLTLGGLSLILGVKPKWGALAVIAFLAGVSPIMHNFWDMEDPNQRMSDMINFSKNMALLGAALALAGVEEPWPASVPIAQPTPMERVKNIGRQAARIAA